MQHAPGLALRCRNAARVAMALALCLVGLRSAVADFPAGREAAGGRADRPAAGGPDERERPGRMITPRAGGDDAGDPQAGRGRARGSWWGSLASLAAVVAMILLGARLWKKHGPLARAGLPAVAVDVLGRRILDPRQSIYLVRLGSRILVLGSTPAGLATLSEITDPVEVDLIAGSCRPAAEEQGHDSQRSFGALFGSHSSGATDPAPTNPASSGAEFDGHLSPPAAEHRRRPEGVHA